MSPRAPTPCCFSTEPDGTSRASSTCPTTSPRSSCRLVRRVEPGRERLAVSAPELALKHRVRKLRRDRRRRMQSLAKSHRSTRNDHLPRNARLGSRRAVAMTFGISRKGEQRVFPSGARDLPELGGGDAVARHQVEIVALVRRLSQHQTGLGVIAAAINELGARVLQLGDDRGIVFSPGLMPSNRPSVTPPAFSLSFTTCAKPFP